MEVRVIKTGLLQTNTYIVIKDNNCIIIDPAFSYKQTNEILKENNYNVVGILLTHGHFDHINDAEILARENNCKIYVNKADLELLFDAKLNGSSKYLKKNVVISKDVLLAFDEEIILKLENFTIDVMFTPGHTKGSSCFRIGNILFSGDTLFRDGIGRTDMYGGNKEDMEQSLKYIFSLNNDITVFPGHGLETNILKERNRYA